jgi:hypothetical protein
LIVVFCRDEAHQIELLGAFKSQGLPCKAVVG